MTQIEGKILDSARFPINGELIVRLDSPLVNRSTSPDELLTLEPHTFDIINGALVGVDLVESQTQNVTYQFIVNSITTQYTYYLSDGTEYGGAIIQHTDGNWYTGTFYEAGQSQRLGRVPLEIRSPVMDFHAVVPNVASVEFDDLLPTGIARDTLPTTVRQVAELITTDADYVQAVRGGPRFQGAYSAVTFYKRDDAVNYAGSSWVYLHPDPKAGQVPSIANTAHWQVLAQKGDAGGTGGNDVPYNATGWLGALWAPSANVLRNIIEQLARLADLANYAPLNAPNFTGHATAVTQAAGNNSARIATTAFVQGEINALGTVPIGASMAWFTNAAPSRWLICDGREIPRTTYSALFAALGTVYGSGNGSTTFNLPDLRGRVPTGADSTTIAGTAGRVTTGANTLGGSGGSERVALTTSEMPSHTHGFTSGGSAIAGGTGTTANVTTGGGSFVQTAIANTGGGASHQNMQPYLVANWIIYAGV